MFWTRQTTHGGPGDCLVFRSFLFVLTVRAGTETMLTYLRKHRQERHVVIIDDISRLARDTCAFRF